MKRALADAMTDGITNAICFAEEPGRCNIEKGSDGEQCGKGNDPFYDFLHHDGLIIEVLEGNGKKNTIRLFFSNLLVILAGEHQFLTLHLDKGRILFATESLIGITHF